MRSNHRYWFLALLSLQPIVTMAQLSDDENLAPDHMRALVVQIEVQYENRNHRTLSSFGAGVPLYFDYDTGELAILTAKHVLFPSNSFLTKGFEILFYGDQPTKIVIGQQELTARAYFDSEYDLALFRVNVSSPPPRMPSLSIAERQDNDLVYAIGHDITGGLGRVGRSWLAEPGRIGSGGGHGPDKITHSATIDTGFSGGALVNEEGELIGINIEKREGGGGLGIAIETVLARLRGRLDTSLLATADKLTESAHAAFRLGVKRAARGQWQATRDLMTRARVNFPFEGQTIRLRGMRTTAYVPSYYLGLAAYRLGECAEALAAWANPAIPRLVGGERRSKRIDRYRQKCREELARGDMEDEP